MWRNIRDLVSNNKSNNNITTKEDINDRAKDFNNFFANAGRETFERKNSTIIYTNPDNVRVTHDTIDNLGKNNFFRPKRVDVETVILTISKLKETKAIGSNYTSLNFIKDSLFVTASYLTCIFNTSIVTGKFPISQKHSIAVPIF